MFPSNWIFLQNCSATLPIFQPYSLKLFVTISAQPLGLSFCPGQGGEENRTQFSPCFARLGNKYPKETLSSLFPSSPAFLKHDDFGRQYWILTMVSKAAKMHNHVQDDTNPVLPKHSQAGRQQLLNAPYTGTAHDEKRPCGHLLAIWDVWTVV